MGGEQMENLVTLYNVSLMVQVLDPVTDRDFSVMKNEK